MRACTVTPTNTFLPNGSGICIRVARLKRNKMKEKPLGILSITLTMRRRRIRTRHRCAPRTAISAAGTERNVPENGDINIIFLSTRFFIKPRRSRDDTKQLNDRIQLYPPDRENLGHYGVFYFFPAPPGTGEGPFMCVMRKITLKKKAQEGGSRGPVTVVGPRQTRTLQRRMFQWARW